MPKTNCEYHTQDYIDFCGPAVAMMILAYKGQSLATIEQCDLYSNLTLNAPAGVATLPARLLQVLDGKLSGQFRLVKATSASEVAREVVQSLLRDVPAAVPILGDAHWAVVYGMDIRSDPPLSEPYEISWVWTHIPMRGKVSTHASGDKCGLFRENGHSYDDWLVLVAQPDPLYRFQCVVDSQPTEIDWPYPPTPRAPAGPLLDRTAVIETVRANLDRQVLSRLSPVGEVRVESTVLVHGLTSGIPDYYLAHIRDSRGVIGLARVDARRRWLRSVGILDKPRDQVFADVEESLQALLEAQIPGAPSSEGWWRKQIEERSRLVWRPCQESLSPYLPLLEIGLPVPPLSASRVHISLAGGTQVFLEPTDLLPGG